MVSWVGVPLIFSLSICCVPLTNLSWSLHPVSHSIFWSPKFELRRHLFQEGLRGHPSNEATLSCCPAYFVFSSYHYLKLFYRFTSTDVFGFFFDLLQKTCSMKAGALSVLLLQHLTWYQAQIDAQEICVGQMDGVESNISKKQLQHNLRKKLVMVRVCWDWKILPVRR